MTDQAVVPGSVTSIVEGARDGMPRPRGRRGSRLGPVGWGVAGVAAVIAIWELYKLLGPADGVTVGGDGSAGSGVILLPRTHEDRKSVV